MCEVMHTAFPQISRQRNARVSQGIEQGVEVLSTLRNIQNADGIRSGTIEHALHPVGSIHHRADRPSLTDPSAADGSFGQIDEGGCLGQARKRRHVGHVHLLVPSALLQWAPPLNRQGADVCPFSVDP